MTRDIQARIRNSSVQLTACIRALLALELLVPGRVLYLATASLQNTPLLSNDLGQFGDLFPEHEATVLTLMDVLSLLYARGTAVRLIHGNDASATSFAERVPLGVEHRADSRLACPGLFTEHGCIRGAIIFGEQAADVGEDRIRIEQDPTAVNRALLEVEQYWEELE